jgi:phage terminase large subunit
MLNGEIDIDVTEVFAKNYDSQKKIIINRGGTRSSKTWSLNQLCALWLITGNYGLGQYVHDGTWTTVRKYRTNLDGTVIRDFEEILKNNNWYEYIEHNKTKKQYKYGKRLVEFIGADDEQKLRGAKRNILYCNEANELEYKQEFFQLLMRTENKIFLDFNPDDEQVWINQELEIKRSNEVGDVQVIVSNYNDNSYLPESLIKEIEYLQQTDKEFWKIYGLGEYGNISGLIFENVKYIDTMPDCKLVAVGLDFGYSLDPSAAIMVFKKDKDLYLKEILYEKGLTNQDLAKRLKPIIEHNEVICDSAEPKSIEELYRLGINAKPAVKGKDSILNGIDILKRYNLNVVNSSNLKRELRTYKWATDKNGNSLQKPIGPDHLLDGLRYVALIHLKENNKGWYVIR